MSIITRTVPKVRHTVADLSKVTMGIDAAKVSDQCRALSGDGDLTTIRNAMINRYAQVIVPQKDKISGAETTALYRANAVLRMDYAAKEAILAGQQEIVRFYLYNSIVRQRATLFTEAAQRYEYEGATADVLEPVRQDSAANIAAQRWDTYADGLGSCALYVSDAGGVLQYAPIPLHKIWVAFAESIDDGGTDRPTNTAELDEASVVVIEIAPDGDKRRFAAWFGPCDQYENGRHAIYCASEWHDIPDVGAEALEYSAGARGFVRGARDPGNPLTLIAQSQSAVGAPVYPIAILYGDALCDGLLPSTSTLFDVCAEIDLMGSLVLAAAGKGARGAKLFNRGRSTNIPDAIDEAMVLADADQSVTNIGWPASNARDAMDVIAAFCRWVSEAHSVPGFLVADDRAGEIPSGVALEMMLLPLTRARTSRIEINRASVARRFALERAVINGAVGTAAISWDDRETWHPGERTWPRDPQATLMNWQTRITMGEADLADVVQEMRGLRTWEQAVNWLEVREAEREASEVLKAPEPPAAPARRLSLAARLAGGGLAGKVAP